MSTAVTIVSQMKYIFPDGVLPVELLPIQREGLRACISQIYMMRPMFSGRTFLFLYFPSAQERYIGDLAALSSYACGSVWENSLSFLRYPQTYHFVQELFFLSHISHQQPCPYVWSTAYIVTKMESFHSWIQPAFKGPDHQEYVHVLPVSSWPKVWGIIPHFFCDISLQLCTLDWYSTLLVYKTARPGSSSWSEERVMSVKVWDSPEQISDCYSCLVYQIPDRKSVV